MGRSATANNDWRRRLRHRRHPSIVCPWRPAAILLLLALAADTINAASILQRNEIESVATNNNNNNATTKTIGTSSNTDSSPLLDHTTTSKLALLHESNDVSGSGGNNDEPNNEIRPTDISTVATSVNYTVTSRSDPATITTPMMIKPTTIPPPPPSTSRGSIKFGKTVQKNAMTQVSKEQLPTEESNDIGLIDAGTVVDDDLIQPVDKKKMGNVIEFIAAAPTETTPQPMDTLLTPSSASASTTSTTTTEDYHFDLSRYTSEYQSEAVNHNNTDIDESPATSSVPHRLINDTTTSSTTATTLLSSRFTHDLAENQIGNNNNNNINNNFNATDDDYTPRKFDDIILTTPQTKLFDQIHKKFEEEKYFNNGENYSNDLQPQLNETTFTRDDDDDDNVVSTSTASSSHGNNHHPQQIVLDAIKANSTDERNSSTYYNNTEIDSVNYDLLANEIHNRTGNEHVVEPSLKRGKYLETDAPTELISAGSTSTSDDNDVELPTSPPSSSSSTTPADWSAALSTKRVEHTKIKDGIYLNITSIKNDTAADINDNINSPLKSNNDTMVTKLLADWVEVMKHNDFANNSYGNEANATVTPPPTTQPQLPPLFSVTSTVAPPPSSSLDIDSASQENQIVTVHVVAATTVRPTTIAPILTVTERLNQSMISASQDLIHKEKVGLVGSLMVDELDDTTITTETSETTTTLPANFGDDDEASDVDDDDVDEDQDNTTPSSSSSSSAIIDETTEWDDQFEDDFSTTIKHQHLEKNIIDKYDGTTIPVFKEEKEPNYDQVVESNMAGDEEKYRSEMSPKNEENLNTGSGMDVNAVIAISVSCVGVICLVLLVAFLFVMRKRQKQLTYGQRCRPVGLDAYSLDNVSVYNSVRRKGALRQSKRAYGNAAFDDPELKNNLLTISALGQFVVKRTEIFDEFKELPTVTARVDEVPAGCEDKNRYANIVPLPETRVYLKRLLDGGERSEYINANFIKGPKDPGPYYIACQAPLDHTVADFWRMIWEQNSRVIIMATDLNENGHERCAEYLPPSVVLDNHIAFGDMQVTLKAREVKDKYAVSTVHLRNATTNTWRELTHFWYQWPDTGVPSDETSMVAMLLEARGYLKMALPDQTGNIDDAKDTTVNNDEDNEEENEKENGADNVKEINEKRLNGGSLDKTKSLQRFQGPLTVHCSPGTGRTGTIIACDIAIRALEQPTRSVDIPQIVYFVRSGRASAVRTREQYEFIYKVANIYATKLTGPIGEN